MPELTTLKFNRTYQILAQGKLGIPIIIRPPFTLDFDITRNTLTSANVCQIRLKNLQPATRALLRKDIYDYTDLRLIELRAGYEDPSGIEAATQKNLVTIFRGNISQCWSVREGVDFVTQIECFDGGFAFTNSEVSLNFPEGTPLKAVITALIATLAPTVLPGAVGNFTTILKKKASLSGSAGTLLRELTGGNFYVDQGRAYAIDNSEYAISLDPVVISPVTGLLGTPQLEQNTARIDMIFEPNINIGQLAELTSLTLDPVLIQLFAGKLFKVTSVKHRGTISRAVCGTAITTAEFFYNKALTPVPGL